MGLFRKKPTPTVAPAVSSNDTQTKPAPYRRIPQHAAADSMINGGQTLGTYFDRQRIAMESRRRMKFAAANELPAADSAYMQAWARGARPLPRPSPYGTSPGGGSYTRSSSGFFTTLPPVNDDDSIAPDDMAKPVGKRHHSDWSNDSGYGSATSSSVVHSRAPSEYGKLEPDTNNPATAVTLQHSESELSIASEANDLSLNELSEVSSDDAPAGPVQQTARRGVLKTRRSSPSPTRSIRSTTSVRSVRKKHARFEPAETTALPLTGLSHDEQEESSFKSWLLQTSPSEPKASSLSSLAGYRVNRKGRVLDEEGGLVAKLVDGALPDCVRQRINSCGEVLSTNDVVIGHVQVVPQPRDGDNVATHLTEAEFAKTYLRPTMTPVPEVQDTAPTTNHSYSPYMYKGEVPATDRSRSAPHLPRSSSVSGRPVVPPFPRHMSTGMVAMKSAQYGPAAGRRSVPYAVGIPGSRPGNVPRPPYNAPPRPSPLASQEHSLNDEQSARRADSWSAPAFPSLATPMSRSASAQTTTSVRTAVPAHRRQSSDSGTRTRTYFTHTGRITVDAVSSVESGTPRPSTDASNAADTSTAPDKTRKSRLSGFFSRGKQGVAA